MVGIAEFDTLHKSHDEETRLMYVVAKWYEDESTEELEANMK